MGRILLSNAKMPGWTTERSDPEGAEQMRVNVYDPDGNLVGAVVYVRRKRRGGGGSVYGWRPAGRPDGWVGDKLDAVRVLAGMPAA